MGNPFFNQNSPTPQMNNPFGNMANMMSQFQQFKSNFQGDPRQKVQELLNSGRMTQESETTEALLETAVSGVTGLSGLSFCSCSHSWVTVGAVSVATQEELCRM